MEQVDIFGYKPEVKLVSGSHGNKHQGAAYVALFKYECLRRGITPLEPEADADAYDIVVSCKGRFWRCQIKGTDQDLDRGVYSIIAGRGCDSKTPYTPEEIDVLAAYVEKAKAWWLIPVMEPIPVHLRLGRMYPEAKDNWDIFKRSIQPAPHAHR